MRGNKIAKLGSHGGMDITKVMAITEMLFPLKKKKKDRERIR